MNDTTAPRPQAQDTVAMCAATMAHDIVAGQLAELRSLPAAWGALNADLQQKSIDRMKEKAANMVRTAIGFMLASEFKAIPAKLEYVSRKKGIAAGLTVDTRAMYRHALSDATGSHVLVIIADPEQWLERMDEIKARGDQLDLFNPDANYDPAIDQPGYRRDQDPLAPGRAWSDLKQSLGLKDPADPAEPKPEEPTDGEGPPPMDVPEGDSLTPEQEHAAGLLQLRADLADLDVHISLGALQARSEGDILAASVWIEWARSGRKGADKLGRPSWLPPAGDKSQAA
jgi:hypothetical protein